jgi:hypothetical protein
MNKAIETINGVPCEIQTKDGFTDVYIINNGNESQELKWIVRKVPTDAAREVAEVVIQHLLKISNPPMFHGLDPGEAPRPLTQDEKEWLLKGGIFHLFNQETNTATISLARNGKVLFTIIHESIQ